MLVAAGADANAPPANFASGTALQLASIKGYVDIVKWLISIHADVDATAGSHGRTALEGAAEHGRTHVVQPLLEEGCQIQGEGKLQFIRAVGFARKKRHHALASHLQSCGGWTEDDGVVRKRKRG